jgi:hypothetical protein
MTLTYALEAAINGPTGPRATLSHGLSRTKPRRRRSGRKNSHTSEVTADGPGRCRVSPADRVEALDGRLYLDSPPGAGTRIRAEIPCQDAAALELLGADAVSRGAVAGT